MGNRISAERAYFGMSQTDLARLPVAEDGSGVEGETEVVYDEHEGGD